MYSESESIRFKRAENKSPLFKEKTKDSIRSMAGSKTIFNFVENTWKI